MNEHAVEQEKIDQNVRRTAGIAALRQIRRMVDEELDTDAVDARQLRLLLRYGWIVLLPAVCLLAYFMGII